MNKRSDAQRTIRVLMCCSDLRVKGGMVSVVKNLLAIPDWSSCRITYIPTHVERSRPVKLAYFAVAYLRVLLLLLFGQVDVVHLHVSERGSVYRKAALLKLAKAFGKPVLLHHHGADFDPFFRALSDKDKAYVLRFLEAADTNIVLSGLIREEFLERAPKARYTVLHNSVPMQPENPYHPDGHLIVTLGRLGQRKGTFDLLQALRNLEPELPADIRFCLCGDGQVEEARALVREYGLEHRLAHIGWISGGDKEALLSDALCHVLPSYREGLPMSILETMSLGIPNISTAIASIPEVIDSGVHGILIQPGDIQALEDALRALCCSRDTRTAMSRMAYDRIRGSFSTAATRERLESIYARAVRGEAI